MTQKYLKRIFSERNERIASCECMSACIQTHYQKKFLIPYVEKTFEGFSVFNFSE